MVGAELAGVHGLAKEAGADGDEDRGREGSDDLAGAHGDFLIGDRDDDGVGVVDACGLEDLGVGDVTVDSSATDVGLSLDRFRIEFDDGEWNLEAFEAVGEGASYGPEAGDDDVAWFGVGLVVVAWGMKRLVGVVGEH